MTVPAGSVVTDGHARPSDWSQPVGGPVARPRHDTHRSERAADVVVIGAGLVGICAALYLQRTGRLVSVIERWRPGLGASGHNGGIFGAASCVPTGTPKVIRSIPHMLVDPL